MEREVFRESGVDRGREGRKEREGGKKREGNGWEWGGGGGISIHSNQKISDLKSNQRLSEFK